jgi:hypothetical protein
MSISSVGQDEFNRVASGLPSVTLPSNTFTLPPVPSLPNFNYSVNSASLPTSADRLALPTFNSGPDQKLAVLDVYSKAKDKVVNSFQDKSITGADVFGSLGVSSLGDIKSLMEGGKDLRGTSVLDRLGNLNTNMGGLVGSSLRSVSAISNIVKALQNSPNTLKNSASATLSNSIYRITASDIKDITNVGKIVNNATGGISDIQIVDRYAVGTLITTTTVSASKLGIPNVFSTMSDKIGDTPTLTGSVKDILPEAVKNKNADTLMDIAGSKIGGLVGSVYPSFNKDLRTVVARPTGMKDNSITKYYDTVDYSLGVVKADYLNANRNNKLVLDAIDVNTSSDFFDYSLGVKAKGINSSISNLVTPDSTPDSLKHATNEKFLSMVSQCRDDISLTGDLNKTFGMVDIKPNVRSVNDYMSPGVIGTA